MANLYTHKRDSIQRTWMLMFVFFLLVIAVGWALSYIYNSALILYIAVGISVIMNIWSYWNSDKLVLRLSHAREIQKSDRPELWNITENLAITAGLPMPRLYIIDDPSPNAFATGRDPEHAVVGVTSGLLNILDRNELQGVIAHELAHIGNRDTLLQTVAVVLVGSLSLLADLFLRAQIFGGNRDNQGGGALAVVGIVLIIIAPIAGTLMRLAISRKREFLADASGALLTRYPEGLASALQKISNHDMPMRHAHTATAHLFIANPFGSVGNKLTKLFATHPPVTDRLHRLRSM